MVTERPSILFWKCDFLSGRPGFTYGTQNLIISLLPRFPKAWESSWGLMFPAGQVLQLTKVSCLEIRKLLGIPSILKKYNVCMFVCFQAASGLLMLEFSEITDYVPSVHSFPKYCPLIGVFCVPGVRQWNRQTQPLPSSGLNSLVIATHMKRKVHK